VKVCKTDDDKLIYYCKGCESLHYVDSRWTFNGDFDNPTFTPSVKVEVGHYPDPPDVCHFFVTDGKIQYLNDCTHKLAGQTIELLDEADWYKD
jgi:hypothetical protein